MRPSAKDISEIEALEAFDGWPFQHSRVPWRTLSERYPEKVVFAKIEKLVRRDLVEYGGNMGLGWLTDAGKDRLAFLRATLTSASMPDDPMRSNSGE